MITIEAGDGLLQLGRQGEHLVRQVRFSVGDWIHAYGSGSFQLMVQRPEDGQPYLADVTLDGDTLLWTLTRTDTAQSGYGRCQLLYFVDDAMAKSETFHTSVHPALVAVGDVPPTFADYLDQMAGVRAAVSALAESMRSDMEACQAAIQTLMESTQQMARNAEQSAETAAAQSALAAQTRAEAAEELSTLTESMRSDMEACQTETKTLAETVQQMAQNARQSAETAAAQATLAAQSESAAATALQSVRDMAQEAAQSAADAETAANFIQTYQTQVVYLSVDVPEQLTENDYWLKRIDSFNPQN